MSKSSSENPDKTTIKVELQQTLRSCLESASKMRQSAAKIVDTMNCVAKDLRALSQKM